MNWTPLIATLAATAFIIGRFPFHRPTLTRQVSRRINDKVLRSEPALKVTHRVYLFANPISGSNRARMYLQSGPEDFWVPFNDSTCAKVCIFNVLEKSEVRTAFEKLGKDLAEGFACTIVIMGGDGGLTHTLNGIKRNQKLLEQIQLMTFVCLPFGSGNDAAKVLGWDSSFSGSYLKDLTSIVKEICLNSTVKRMNIWDLYI